MKELDWLLEKVVDFYSSPPIAGANEFFFFPLESFLQMAKTVIQFGGKKWGMYRVESSKQTDVQSRRIIQIDTWIMQRIM